MVDFCNTIDLNMVDLGFSPITGGTGNIEFLSYINKGGNKIINEEKVLETIEDAHRSLY